MALINTYLAPVVLDQLALATEKTSIPFKVAVVGLLGGAAYISMMTAVKEHGLGIGNTQWNALSTVLGVAAGSLLFQETITQYQGLGIVLCVGGLVLMSNE